MLRYLLPLAVVAVPQFARAECAEPTGVAPFSSDVPHHASVFVYRDQTIDHRPDQDVPVFANWVSGHGTATITQVAPTIARVDLDGEDEAIVSINHHGYGVKASLYPGPDPQIESVMRERDTLSSRRWDDVLVGVRHVDHIAAVRADWTFHGRVATYWAIPQQYDVSEYQSHAVIELGKVNCGGMTIPVDELAAGGTLALTAVMVDGAERPLTPKLEISDSTLPVSALPTPVDPEDAVWPRIEPRRQPERHVRACVTTRATEAAAVALFLFLLLGARLLTPLVALRGTRSRG